MVAALNPLRAKASFDSADRAQVVAIQHHALDSPTGPRACRNSLTSKTSITAIKKKQKVRTFRDPFLKTAEELSTVLEATCGVALQPLPHSLTPKTVDISRDNSEARCRFGLLLCAPTRFFLCFIRSRPIALTPSRTTSKKLRTLPWHIVQMR